MRRALWAAARIAATAACSSSGSSADDDKGSTTRPASDACPRGTVALGKPGEMTWCEKRRGEAVVKHGPFRMWWPNKSRSQRGAYVDGKRTGNWTMWWKNGKLQEEGRYLADRKQGVWRSYDENGQLSAELTFDKGELEGKQRVRAGKDAWKLQCYRGGKKLWEGPEASTRERTCGPAPR